MYVSGAQSINRGAAPDKGKAGKLHRTLCFFLERYDITLQGMHCCIRTIIPPGTRYGFVFVQRASLPWLVANACGIEHRQEDAVAYTMIGS